MWLFVLAPATHAAPNTATPPPSSDFVYDKLFTLQDRVTALEQKAAPSAQTSQELTALSQKVNTLRATQDHLKADLIPAYEERVSDLSLYTNIWGIALNAILVIAAVVVGFSIVRKAKSEAREAAQAEMKSIKSDAERIKDNSEQQLDNLYDRICDSFAETFDKFAVRYHDLDAKLDGRKPDKPSPETLLILKFAAEIKPEDKRNAKDHLRLASYLRLNDEPDKALKALKTAHQQHLSTPPSSEEWRSLLEEIDNLTLEIHIETKDISAALQENARRIQLYNTARQQAQADHQLLQEESLRIVQAAAYLKQGMLFQQLEKHTDATKQYDIALRLIKNAWSEDAKIVRARIYPLKSTLAEQQEGMKLLDRAIKELEGIDNEEARTIRAKSYFNKSTCVEQTEEIKLLDRAIKELEGIDNEEARTLRAKSYFNKSTCVEQTEEMKLLDRAIKELEGIEKEDARTLRAKSYFNKSTCVEQTEEMKLLDRAVKALEGIKNQQACELRALCYHKIINNYSKMGNLNKARQTLRCATENAEEIPYKERQIGVYMQLSPLYLRIAPKAETLEHLTRCEDLDTEKVYAAFMQFLRFMLDDIALEDLCATIAQAQDSNQCITIPRDVWEYIATTYTGAKLAQIEALLEYFLGHQNIETLKAALAAIAPDAPKEEDKPD
jgi:tetratricopeptide (TPR) repeat protein